MLLFLVSWFVLSAVAGVIIGRAIHHADVVELGRTPCLRPGPEVTPPDAPTISTWAHPAASRPDLSAHAWAA